MQWDRDVLAASDGPIDVKGLAENRRQAPSAEVVIGARLVKALDRLSTIQMAQWELDRAVAAHVYRMSDARFARPDEAMKGVWARFHDEVVSTNMYGISEGLR